ncbi:hypothetical protein K2V61_12535 [Staphylococcus simulans]|uniref:hypothetical protein n=1 Tax=Staphylococcus simulans TaxID=1286 RepID=UPI001E3AADE8|nr:hypothetical protein [Staphylococcus simulans]MCD8916367.1 hypothetical protein [Staphylococcus simulans]
MALKPKIINDLKNSPYFLRDAMNLEYTVGNPVLDGSKFDSEKLVKAGTAISKNKDTGLFELVTEGTSELVAPVLTANDVTVLPNENQEVSAVRKASVYEELCTGVTQAFKDAVQGRIVFDV